MTSAPLTFLCVATEWSSGRGGLSTFNRELCRALAAENQQVVCLVASATPEEVGAARQAGVELLSPPDIPGLNELAILCTEVPDLARFNVDVVVGHGRITGPAAVAQLRRLRCERYVHFLHMAPSRIEWLKQKEERCATAEERTSTEVALGTHSELVVAVGPELHSHYSIHFGPLDKPMLEYLPGLTEPATHSKSPPLGKRCLMFGRTEDSELKGIDFAARALGHLSKDDKHRRVQLTIRGADPKKADELKANLQQLSGPSACIDVTTYTTDAMQLRLDLHGSSLVLMPSQEEGFGLAGLEAISEGIPVLLSNTSGLALALRQRVAAEADFHIVDVTEGTECLASRMGTILLDREGAFERVRRLREAMRPSFSWKESTRALLRHLTPRLPPLSPPSAPPDSGTPTTPQTQSIRQGDLPSPVETLISVLTAASQDFATTISASRKHLEWIEPPERQTLLAALPAIDQPTIAIALLGAPGSGKSSLLSSLLVTFAEAGTPVLAIKADAIPAQMSSLEELQRHLQIPHDIASTIEATARMRPTAVLIDQLDALSDGMDVSTRRLTMLLSLVERLSKGTGILVIVSCRTFDFNHDLRFERIAFQKVALGPTTKSAVEHALSAAGYNAATFSASAIDFLRTPQHLAVLVSLPRGPQELELPNTYHELLSVLWDQLILSEPLGNELEASACKLAEHMCDHEELWLSRTSASIPPSHTEQLLRSNVLVQNGAGTKVAFAHQTLFSFALARSFARTHMSLATFVTERQDTVFIRPHLWTILPYLRSHERSQYHRELRTLLDSSNLRPHIRSLLLQFLGGESGPSLQERELVASALQDPTWTKVTLEAIWSNPDWFANVPESLLASLMHSHPHQMVIVLAKASEFDLPRTNRLLSTEWLVRATNDDYVASTLWRSPSWDSRTIEVAERIIERQEGATRMVPWMMATAVEAIPKLAPRLVGAELNKRERIALGQDMGENEDDIFGIDRPMEKLLRETGQLHALHESAKAAPREFLAVAWPWFIRILSHISATDERHLVFDRDLSLETDPDEGVGPRGIAAAIAGALAEVASDVDYVTAFVREQANCNCMSAHRHIAFLLRASLPSGSRICLEYLTGDARRLTVGESGEMDGDTMRLLSALAPHLSSDDVHLLENAIDSSRVLSEQHGDRDWRKAAFDENRRHRLRLLSALGSEHLTEQGQKSLRELTTSFPGYAPRPRTDRHALLQFIGSPVSAQQMARARDEHILKLFEQLPDSTATHHPKRSLRGGSVQASREFAELAKLEPERVVALLPKLSPTNSQRPAAYAIEALSPILPMSRLEALVLDLHDRGFHSEDFRTTAAYALCNRADLTNEMSESTIALLESWLVPSDTTEVDDPDLEVESPRSSILWSRNRGGILPRGNYPVLIALAAGYIDRREPMGNAWLSSLERHAERIETTAVWRAISSTLVNALSVDSERAGALFDRVFSQHPAILRTPQGVVLVAASMRRVELGTVWAWMQAIQRTPGIFSAQAYGELLALLATRPTTLPHASDALDVLLASRDGDARDEPTHHAIIGIAHGAAHLWLERDRRHTSTRVLSRMLQSESDEVLSAAMGMFSSDRTVPWDEDTQSILELLLAHQRALGLEGNHGFTRLLAELVMVNPEVVARLSLALVDQAQRRGSESALAECGEQLTRLALTAQRLGNEARELGLQLFEKLLEAGAFGAQQVLDELDLRPTRTPARARHTRSL